MPKFPISPLLSMPSLPPESCCKLKVHGLFTSCLLNSINNTLRLRERTAYTLFCMLDTKRVPHYDERKRIQERMVFMSVLSVEVLNN